jgi:hypothetical protein
MRRQLRRLNWGRDFLANLANTPGALGVAKNDTDVVK